MSTIITRLGKKLKHIKEFLSDGEYTLNTHDNIMKSTPDEIGRYLEFISESSYDKYKMIQYFCNGIITSNTFYDHNMFFKFNDIDDYVIHLYTIESFNEIINTSKNNIVIKPIYCVLNDKHHMMSLIIDIENEIVTIFDPNIDMIVSVFENIIMDIFEHYNIEYNTNYIIRFQTLEFKKLNKAYNKDYGFCIILSILIPHYMLLTNLDIYSVLKVFNNFKLNNIDLIIKSYSITFLNFRK